MDGAGRCVQNIRTIASTAAGLRLCRLNSIRPVSPPHRPAPIHKVRAGFKPAPCNSSPSSEAGCPLSATRFLRVTRPAGRTRRPLFDSRAGKCHGPAVTIDFLPSDRPRDSQDIAQGRLCSKASGGLVARRR